MAHQGKKQPSVTINPAYPATPYQQAPPPQKPRLYSGFTSKKEEELYDQVAGSLLRLLSMRMALQFQIAAPTVSRRLQRDDERLKRAIGKHYKKLCMLERVKYTEFRFSECVTDLVLAMGF